MMRKFGVFLCGLLPAAMIAPLSLNPPAYAATSYSTSVDPSTQFQTVEGWGTSLAWWAQVVGGFSNNTEYADKIFGSDGLNLNVARYNIGGGENPDYLPPNKTFLPFRTRIPGFESADGTWDWNADANQRWMLQAAKERGANQFEAFSNSPPYWMTNSGSVTGSTTGTTDNLNPAYYDSFADYLTTVVQHYKDEWGITFKTVTPLNEPISTWWKFGNNQEGAHFDRTTQDTILGKVAASLSSKGLSTKISASDENSIDNALISYNTLSSSTKNALYQINTHSYSGSKRVELANAAQSNGKQLWMSEYGDKDTSGLTMSKTILKDMKQMHPTAWIYWQAVDSAAGWGLLRNPLDGSGNTSYTFNQKYYIMGNYSKFIRPGYKIIAINDANSLAAYDPESSTVVIVTTNSGTTDTTVSYDLSKFSTMTGSVTPFRTSPTEQLAQLPSFSLTNKTFSAIVPAGSVTTYVISGAAYTDRLGLFNPSTYYTLSNENSGLMVDVNGASTSQGATVMQWNASSGLNQQWSIQGLGDGTFYIVNRNSGMAMDVSGASKNAGANVIQWPYNDGNNQKWRITGIGDGFYKLVNVNSGMLLDVSGNTKTGAATLTQSPDNDSASQHWKIQLIAPNTTAALSPTSPNGEMNWYVSPVTLTLTATDSLKSVASTVYSYDDGVTWNHYTGPISFSQDGKYRILYYSTNEDGGVENPKTVLFNLDQIAPSIHILAPTDNSYLDDSTVAVNFSVTDTLSGVEDSTVAATLDDQPIENGTVIALFKLSLGQHVLAVTAADHAGNSTTATKSFSTTTSVASLERLVDLFFTDGSIDNFGIANSLRQKLQDNDLQSFIDEVSAQSSKHISSEVAAYLLRDAKSHLQ